MARKHLERETEQIKKLILELCDLVENLLSEAMNAFLERNEEKAKAAFEIEDIIDGLEMKIEEECLKILALHQPMAADLRYIIAVLKINEELERIADLSALAASHMLSLQYSPREDLNTSLKFMLSKVTPMLKQSIDSFLRGDGELAERVCESDPVVDKLHHDFMNLAEKEIKQHPESVSEILHYISVSHGLERVADLATNIAEDVIYFLDGKIVRHRLAEVLINKDK